MNKVISLGEVVVDTYYKNNKLIDAFIGGAPLNLAYYVSYNFKPVIFLTKLGNDKSSKNVLNLLKSKNIDTSYIICDSNLKIASSKVSLNENNDREFSFNLEKASFLKYKKEELPLNIFMPFDIFYFGSVFLLSKNGQETTLKALKYCKEKNIRVAFDVNYRSNLFPNINDFYNLIKNYLPYVNILKVSEEELGLLDNDPLLLFNLYPSLKVIFVTKGSKGASYFTKNNSYYLNGIKVKVVDTTGCGDSFFGTVLANLLEDFDYSNLNLILKKAIEISSKVAGIKGSLI